jgi:hypothetical protein
MSALPLIQEKESVSVPWWSSFWKKTVCTWSVSPGCKVAAPGVIPWMKLCGRSLTTSVPCLKLVTCMVTVSHNLSRMWISPFPSPCGAPSHEVQSWPSVLNPKLDNQLPLRSEEYDGQGN